MNTRIWPALAALATGALCAGLTAAPSGAATTAAGAPCIDAPGDATCDGVSPYQLGKNGISYWPR